MFAAPVAATAAEAVEPVRVLLINSFGGENSPYEVFASNFRSRLPHHTSRPIAFYEVTLDAARFDPARDTDAFVRYLRDRFDGRTPNLVVPVGPPAALFYAKNRAQLFPATPMMPLAVEERVTRGIPLGPQDGSTTLRLRIARLVEHILEVLPATTTLAIVIGNAPIERYWVQVAREELRPFEDRISFRYLNALSLEEVEREVASLPQNSAILFTQMYVDGAGVSREHDRALARVRGAANSAVFGLFRSQLGKGIIGGPLMSEEEAADRAAELAHMVLDSGAPQSAEPSPLELGTPVYDWRELKKWGIAESRLPPGSQTLYRQPTFLEAHFAAAMATAVVIVLQFLLLAGLVMQRARRRRAEDEARMLGGRILTAHEDERRRLARELHDDVTPRLARLAIDAARIEQGREAGAKRAEEPSMHSELVQLSEDVHALSYRLHPTMLEDLGLLDALRAECDRTSRGQDVHVEFDVKDVPETIPDGLALCLFRVTQEALRNAVVHGKASAIHVVLDRKDGGLELTVSDDGAGFDATMRQPRPGLGLASMRERVRLVGGELAIGSAPGAGTKVAAWAPVPRSAS